MKSPFAKGRFEHEASQIYFLPTEIIPHLEEFKSTYIVGSRGSGKTTLLKSLSWNERIQNETLLAQLDGNPFRGAFIGTYVQLPKIQVRSIDVWLQDEDDQNYGEMFALYLDLIAIELMTGACAELLAFGNLNVPFAIEQEQVRKSTNLYKTYLLMNEPPESLRELWNSIRQFRKNFEKSARLRIDPKEFLERYDVPGIGELSRTVGSHLAELMKKAEDHDLVDWHFKICMDEAECLSNLQLRTVNTLVRLCEWPVSYVVSFVGQPRDVTTTLFPKLSQQKADCNIQYLDDLGRNEFKKLCEGVATVRIRSAVNNDSLIFDSSKVLGDLDLNGLVESMVNRSESDTAVQLKGLAENFRSNWAENRIGSANLPYIEAYLADKLELKVPDDSTENKQRRKQESAEFRKKIVAAYLSICNDLKVKKIPYASANMVLGISDNCIRDFISQMDYIFRETGLSVSEFGKLLEGQGKDPISSEIQSNAIHQASEEKDRSIPDSPVLTPIQVGKLVRGLGELTGILQRGGVNTKHLQSSERGVFIKYESVSGSATDSITQMIQDAADAGFLKMKTENDGIIAFRIHCSLSPVYGLSYRGAYYPVPLKDEDLERFLTCEGKDKILQVARSIAQRFEKPQAEQEKQRLLFPDELESFQWKDDHDGV